jgi:hypothetical protein
MSSVFDYGGKAVNKNTAMAISGGTNYEPVFGDKHIAPLFKIKPVLPEQESLPKQIIEQQKQYIGERRSRLVVVAWFATGGKWLCRCDCGYYTIRKLSFLTHKDIVDACPECLFVIEKRRHNNWVTTGKDLPREYFA